MPIVGGLIDELDLVREVKEHANHLSIIYFQSLLKYSGGLFSRKSRNLLRLNLTQKEDYLMPATTISADMLFTTASLIETFRVVPLAPQFLRDKLFPRVSEVASDLVAVDFYSGTQKLAHCSRFSKGTAVPREKGSTSLFSPPFIKPIRNLTADELFYKSAVQAANATGNRDAELMLLDFQELDAMISRREEWMASECIFKGTVTCRDGDTNEVVAELVYGTPTKTVPAKLWSDPASDPLADLRGALRLVSGASGASADLIVMGRDAADAFESNPQRFGGV